MTNAVAAITADPTRMNAIVWNGATNMPMAAIPPKVWSMIDSQSNGLDTLIPCCSAGTTHLYSALKQNQTTMIPIAKNTRVDMFILLFSWLR